MGKFVTIDDVINAIDYLSDDCQNPVTEYGDCVYSDEDGNHCLIGDVLVNLGFDVPAWDDWNNSNPIHQVIEELYPNNFHEDAIEMLAIGQQTADRLTHQNNHLAWGLAKHEMREWYIDCKEG